MTDHIFISYSKKDSDFALKLAKDLQEAGFKIWIDRTIGGGDKWRETIEKNLKAAEEVIIVVSPNSMASEWVKHEGSLAYGWSKKLIPILMEPVDSLPPWLEEYQWVDFVDTPYDAAFEALVKDLTPPNPIQDLLDQQVQAHRQTGALIGEAILQVILETRDTLKINEEAERLIQSSVEKSEKEQKEQKKRRRLLTLSAVGSALVFLVLAIIAWGQRNLAIDAQVEAERMAQIGRARELAALAQAEDDSTGSLNLMLAREAALTTWSDNIKIFPQHFLTNEAFNALHDAVHKAQQLPWVMTLPQNQGHIGAVTSVAYSPDGKRIVSSSFDGTIRVWDADSGKELKLLIGHTGGVSSLAFSPDGNKMVSGSYFDDTLRLWDVETGNELKRWKGHDDGVASVAYGPNGERIVSGGLDRIVRLWDADSGEELREFKGHTEVINAVAYLDFIQTGPFKLNNRRLQTGV